MVCLESAGWMANSADPDQTSALGMHCLLFRHALRVNTALAVVSVSLTIFWANSADNEIFFFFFSQETGFDFSCKLSPGDKFA